jgi:hypothetical protein
MKNKAESHNTIVDIADTLGVFEENKHESNAEIADREEVSSHNFQHQKQIPENDPMYYWDRVKQNKDKFDW